MILEGAQWIDIFFFQGQKTISEEFHRQMHVGLGLSVSTLDAPAA